MTGSGRDKLIVALDVDTLDEAKSLIDQLKEEIDIFKVGSQLFTSCGPAIVHHLLDLDKKVFLDLKYHDIPHTVASAVRAAVNLKRGDRGIFMCTVHTSGGPEMLQEAAKAAKDEARLIGVTCPHVLGITVLTSDAKTDNIHDLVCQRARLANECGLDGVVASGQEVAALRREMGDDFVIVTPGIRPTGAETGDQKRITTPKKAIADGSSFLVVGRPIVKASDPVRAAKDIIGEIGS